MVSRAGRKVCRASSTSMRVMCWPGTTTSPTKRLVMSTFTVSFVDEGVLYCNGILPAASRTVEELGKRYSKVPERMIFRSCVVVKNPFKMSSELAYVGSSANRLPQACNQA